MPEGFALRDRFRTALAGSPISTDRIEFTLFVFTDKRRYGLVVLVPLLSTPCFHDAVTVQYRTILHRTEADLHRFDQTPSQAHERARPRAQQAPPAPTRWIFSDTRLVLDAAAPEDGRAPGCRRQFTVSMRDH
jgi:hypothetical protein